MSKLLETGNGVFGVGTLLGRFWRFTKRIHKSRDLIDMTRELGNTNIHDTRGVDGKGSHGNSRRRHFLILIP